MVQDPVGDASQEEPSRIRESAGAGDDEVRRMLLGVLEDAIDGIPLEEHGLDVRDPLLRNPRLRIGQHPASSLDRFDDRCARRHLDPVRRGHDRDDTRESQFRIVAGGDLRRLVKGCHGRLGTVVRDQDRCERHEGCAIVPG